MRPAVFIEENDRWYGSHGKQGRGPVRVAIKVFNGGRMRLVPLVIRQSGALRTHRTRGALIFELAIGG